MPISLLTAIANAVAEPVYQLGDYSRSRSRANNMGEALEEYIKDLFAGTIGERDTQARLRRVGEVFSYTGNQNKPPDLIIRGGDAIEIKKIENPNSVIALNSSYPKAMLYSDSPMISNACRGCENWQEKKRI